MRLFEEAGHERYIGLWMFKQDGKMFAALSKNVVLGQAYVYAELMSKGLRACKRRAQEVREAMHRGRYAVNV